jgi:hypothetical protein
MDAVEDSAPTAAGGAGAENVFRNCRNRVDIASLKGSVTKFTLETEDIVKLTL